MKPLFIPLAGKWYDLFASGHKVAEYRLYGPRWNERTCRPGRDVVLSRGYGTKHRLQGVIVGFSKLGGHELNEETRAAAREIWKPGALEFAEIRIAVKFGTNAAKR